jgi:hypothetical protein
MLGPQLCDRCYELETRIQRDPALAAQILNSGKPTEGLGFPFCPNYESLRDELGKLPATWYPDLIRSMVEAAYAKKVFVKGGASRLISNLEKTLGESLAEKDPNTES